MSRMVVASQSSLWQTTSGSLKGTIPWLAIEFLKPGKLQYRHTKETDVWAFGMTIFVSKHIVTTRLYVAYADVVRSF